jgi:hypothetical protein
LARIGGRSSWIAVPAGMVCTAIVAVLIWLSLPMVPVTIAWAGDTMRRATAPRVAAPQTDTPALRIGAGDTMDCRSIYTDSLWNELTWQGKAVLDQSFDPPATAVTTLTEVLAPDVRLTCAWRIDGAPVIVTTLAVVAADAPALTEAALLGQGFTCGIADGALRCSRVLDGVTEVQVVRDGLWMSSVESGWRPERFSDRVEAEVWG